MFACYFALVVFQRAHKTCAHTMTSITVCSNCTYTSILFMNYCVFCLGRYLITNVSKESVCSKRIMINFRDTVGLFL